MSEIAPIGDDNNLPPPTDDDSKREEDSDSEEIIPTELETILEKLPEPDRKFLTEK